MNVQDQKLEGTIADLQQQLGTAKQRIEELESFQFNYEYAVKIEREDHKAELEAAERKLARARDQFEALGSVVPCERYEDDVLLNGLCLISDMVAPANPKYPMLEAYEAVAVWLNEYARAALAQVEQPQCASVKRLTKDEWATINKLRGKIIDEFFVSGVETPLHTALNKIADWYLEPFDQRREEALRKIEALAQIEQPPTVIDIPADHALSELYKDPQFLKEYREGLTEERARLGIQQPRQQLPDEDPDDGPCQCSACVALRARAQAERTP